MVRKVIFIRFEGVPAKRPFGSKKLFVVKVLARASPWTNFEKSYPLDDSNLHPKTGFYGKEP